jgi:hypothetical protein
MSTRPATKSEPEQLGKIPCGHGAQVVAGHCVTWLIDHNVISEMGNVGQVMSDEHRTQIVLIHEFTNQTPQRHSGGLIERAEGLI